MRMNDTSKGKLCILDFGLVARINEEDQDAMVNSIVHLANKDYPALVDDFIDLKILPDDCDRAKVVPLMDKALSPYVKGGGAKKYEAELKKIYNMDGSMVESNRWRVPGDDSRFIDRIERYPVFYSAVFRVVRESCGDFRRHRVAR